LDDLVFCGPQSGGHTLRYGFSAAMVVVLIAAALFIHPRQLSPGGVHSSTSCRHRQRREDEPGAPIGGPVAIRPVALPETGVAPLPPSTAAQMNAERVTETDRSPIRLTWLQWLKLPNNNRIGRPVPPPPMPFSWDHSVPWKRPNGSVARYQKKGIPAHWQMVGKNRWYRIVSGKFEDIDQATRYQRTHGLNAAIIIDAPLTVKVLPRRPDVSDADIRRFLSKIGYDSLMEMGPAGDNEIYTGLFLSIEDATITAERINSIAAGCWPRWYHDEFLQDGLKRTGADFMSLMNDALRKKNRETARSPQHPAFPRRSPSARGQPGGMFSCWRQ
jgi:hypothetical protein